MKFKNKIISLVASFFTVFNTISYAQVLNAKVNPSELEVGDELTLEINVNSVQKFRGIQFDVKYDKDEIEFVDFEKLEIFDKSMVGTVNSNNAGVIKVMLVFQENIDYEGEFANVTFKVNSDNGDGKISIVNMKSMVDGQSVDEDLLELSFDVEEDKTNGNSSSSNRPTGGGSSSSSGSLNLKPTVIPNNSVDKEDVTVDTVNPFIDVTGHWAEDVIVKLNKAGVINGVSDDTFLPDKQVTRAEFCQMISKALELTDKNDNIFTDVKSDDWFEDGVLKCVKAGIVSGFDGKFRPNDIISREEMAVVLNNTQKHLGVVADGYKEASITDVDSVSEWALEAVYKVMDSELMNGFEDGSFKPKDVATRAQAAKVIDNLL